MAGGRKKLLPWEKDTLYNIFLPSLLKYDTLGRLQEANCPCYIPATAPVVRRKYGSTAGKFLAKKHPREHLPSGVV